MATFNQSSYQYGQEPDESLLKSTGKKALGGIAALGNILDIPGSMVRDVLGGKNPLDQLLTPLRADNRLTGRDLLRKYGMIGRKDSWGNFAGGLAAEVLTDPLTWVMPFGAATKAGKVVQSAGQADDILKLAAKKAGTNVGNIGRREANLNVTMKDVIKNATPDQLNSLKQAAKGEGVQLKQILDEPMQGMLGIGPFGNAKRVYGTGEGAKKYAKALDTIGGTIRYGKIPGTEFSPVDSAARLMNSKLGGVPGRVGQYFHKRGFDAREGARADAGMQVDKWIKDLSAAGVTDDQARNLRSIFESHTKGTPFQQLDPAAQKVITEVEDAIDSAFEAVKAEGGSIDRYESPASRYFPRYGVVDESSIPSGATTSKGFSASNPSTYKRSDIFRPYTDETGEVFGIADETNTIDSVIADEEIGDLIDARRPVDEVANKIREKYGDKIPEFYNDSRFGGKVEDRYSAMAQFIAKLPEGMRASANLPKGAKASGIFANNPMMDLHTYLTHSYGQAASLRNLRDMLHQPGVLFAPSQTANQTGFTSLRDAIAKTSGKIDEKEFAMKMYDETTAKLTPAEKLRLEDNIASTYGKTAEELKPEEIASYVLDHRVSEETAEAISKTMLGFEGPKAGGELLQFFDSLTNLWKGLQTVMWPGFHSRNFVSGQVQNWMSGMWSPESVKDTWKLMRGGTVPGAAKIPAVKKVASERGIQDLTDEAATGILGELAEAHGMTSRYAGEAGARTGLEAAPKAQRMDEALRQVPRPGYNAANFGDVGRKAVGLHPDSSFNPLDVRGFRGRQESKFAPMAAGEEISPIVEGFNRIAPFIQQLKKGVDPLEAATRVGRAQVNYASRFYTPFERDVLKRIFPFYSFSSRMPIWLVNELVKKPGGKLAQTVRAINGMRDPQAMTPDYVSETASIPLSTSEDGTDHYLTGAGLMFEDPLSFLGGGMRGGLLEVASRTNPMIKAPAEWATGQSFFQKGPMGGRSLEDLDPTIGRTLANLTGRKDPVPTSKALEFIATNTIGRPLTAARTMTYPVNDPSLGTAAKTAMNLLTGARITSISPAAQDALLREEVHQSMRKVGGRTFTRMHIPADVEAKMDQDELQEARKLEALLALLSQRAKERAAKE